MELAVGDRVIWECPLHRWAIHSTTITPVYKGQPSSLFICRASPVRCSWWWFELVFFSNTAHVRNGRAIMLRKADPGEVLDGYLDGNWHPPEEEPPEPEETTLDDFSREESPGP